MLGAAAYEKMKHKRQRLSYAYFLPSHFWTFFDFFDRAFLVLLKREQEHLAELVDSYSIPFRFSEQWNLQLCFQCTTEG